MADISESLFQSIDTIVMKRLEAINFDNTNIYTIKDVSRSEYGEYKVTDGNITFTAYSQDTNYKENEAVYVTIPNNDFNQQKLIIGKYIANSDTPFIFTAPTSTMIDVTGNIIQGQIPEVSLTANAPNDGLDDTHIPYPYNNQTEENEEEKIIWQLNCRNKNYVGFERLGLKADFKTWLNEFDCVQGHYGLKLKLKCLNTGTTFSASTFYELVKKEIANNNMTWVINTSGIVKEVGSNNKDDILNYIEEQLKSAYDYYYFTLDTSDMIGNPYNFVSYHRQEQVFDISKLGQIIEMELSLYQNKDFKNIGGQDILWYDEKFRNILLNNIFAIDPYIMLGYDLEGFDGEKAFLISTDSLTYKQDDAIEAARHEELARDLNDLLNEYKENNITKEEYEAKKQEIINFYHDYNKKVIHLSWLHEDDDGKINSIETETDVNGTYEIRWYERSIGAPSPDGWAGVDWKLRTEDDEGNDVSPTAHAFQYTLMIDEESYQKANEQIKAFVIFIPTTGATKPIPAEAILFKNERTVISAAEKDLNRGLSLKCLDGSEGDYYLYRQDYNLVDDNDANIRRVIECHLNIEEGSDQGVLQEAKTIAWHIPIHNTMLFAYSGDTTLPFVDYQNLSTISSYYEIDENQVDSTPDYFNLSYTDPRLVEYKYIDPEGLEHSCKSTGFLYKKEENPLNDELFIIWYGNPDKGYAINPYLSYTINSTYSQEATQNNIICEVNKNNRDYIGAQDFTFGTAGTNGTAYTLTINMYNVGSNNQKIGEEIALTEQKLNDPNRKYLFEASLRNTKTKEIVDFNNAENNVQLNWEWWKGTETYKEIQYAEAKYLFDNNITTDKIYYKNGEKIIDDNETNESHIEWDDDFTANGAAGIINSELKQYFLLISNANSHFTINSNNLYLDVDTESRNKCYLIVNGRLTLDNLLYLKLTVTGFGNYPLTTIYPVPIRAAAVKQEDEENENIYTLYTSIAGAKYICYPPTGYPEYYNNPYILYQGTYDLSNDKRRKVSNDTIVEGNVQWIIYAPHSTGEEAEDYIGAISEKNILQPADFYVVGNPQYGVQAKVGDKIVWTQPIWVYQNQYFSTTINEWDGKELKIDKESGTILANAIAAGKKNPDNTFSGIMMGDWSRTDISQDVGGRTGLYGFYHNNLSYGFMEDGTGFIGQSGRGKILFDGNSSEITSNGYKLGNGGTLIDLDDGYQEFINRNNGGGYVEIPVNATTFAELMEEGLYAPRKVNNNETYQSDKIYLTYDEDHGIYLKEIVTLNNYNSLKSKLYILEEIGKTYYNNFIETNLNTYSKKKSYILDLPQKDSLIINTPTYQSYATRINPIWHEVTLLLLELYYGIFSYENNQGYTTEIPCQPISESIIDDIMDSFAFKAIIVGDPTSNIYSSEQKYYHYVENYKVIINAKNDNLRYDDHALQIGTNDNPSFYVQWDGSIHARNGEFNGDIKGGSIDIGPEHNFVVDYAGNVYIGSSYPNSTVTISNYGDFWAGHNILHIDPFGVFSVADETFKIDSDYFYAGKILDNNGPTGEYTLTINNEGQFEAGRTKIGNNYVAVLEIDKTGKFSAGNGVLKIDPTGRLTINDDAFFVTPEGVTNINYLSGYEAYFEQLSVDTLSILNQVDSDVTFNGDVFFNGKVLAGTFYNNIIHNPDLNIYLSTVEKGITFQEREYPTSYVPGKVYYAKKTISGGAGWGERTLYLGNINSDDFTAMKNMGYSLFYYESKPGSLSSEGNNLIKIWSGTPDNQGSLAGTIGYEAGATSAATTVNIGISSNNYTNSEGALCHTSIILESDSNISLKANGGGNFGIIYANSRQFWFGPSVFYYQGDSYAPYVRYNDDNHTLEWLTDNGNGGFTPHDYRYAYFA